MWNATLKGLRAHALRLVLTGLAIVLGVAFVSGTLVLTDTMRASFDDVVAATAGGIDLQLRGESAFTSVTGMGSDRAGIAPEVIDEIRAVEGVRAAEGVVPGTAHLQVGGVCTLPYPPGDLQHIMDGLVVHRLRHLVGRPAKLLDTGDVAFGLRLRAEPRGVLGNLLYRIIRGVQEGVPPHTAAT